MNEICAYPSAAKPKSRTKDMRIGQVARLSDHNQFYMRAYDGFVPLNGAAHKFTADWNVEVEEILPTGTILKITLD